MNKLQLEHLMMLLNYVGSLDSESEQSLTDLENNTVFAGLSIKQNVCSIRVTSGHFFMDGIREIQIDLNSNPIVQFELGCFVDD